MFKNVSDAQFKLMDLADFDIPDLISNFTLRVAETLNQMTEKNLCSVTRDVTPA